MVRGIPAEADVFHRRAVAAAPRNPDILSNFGNHLVQIGDENGAKERYLSAISVDPAARKCQPSTGPDGDRQAKF